MAIIMLALMSKVTVPEEMRCSIDTEISEVAEEIITSKGQCRPTLAKKIRGTETFWRSWLGRDYRMDWQYEKQSDGSMKIKIRNIGCKKSFTYGF